MKRFRIARWLMLALLLSLIPASSFAGIFISVGFAPPVLPVYDQPVCPQPGLMWTPGYWAYGPDGYYWVPGAWVPVPYEGALWTPGYWGWSAGLYVWHPGYWGRHVGYYGGVNYGFGYFGIGFAGGMWRGHDFVYNTAVVHVGGNIHNTYVDRTVVNRYTVVNNHVAFSGGPGGVNHPPTAQENTYSHEGHTAPTSFQTQQESSARTNTNAYASHNGGRTNTVTTSGTINYNASKSNTGNRTVQTTGGSGGHSAYGGGSSQTGGAPTGGYGHSGAVNNTTTRSNTQHNTTVPQPQSHGGGQSHTMTNNDHHPEHH